jgi:hypothetical protein
MGFNKQVESLRRATLEQREAAARAAPTKEALEYTPFQRFMWCVVQVLRHAWLNIYPLLAVVVGVVFVVCVKQTREILGDLQQDLILVSVLGVWAASIWYSMRMLSSTDFPGDEEAHPAAGRIAPWLNGESPRFVPFAGLVIIACTVSIFLTEHPSPHWIAPLAAGIVPVTWAAQQLGDWLAGLWQPLKRRPVYRPALPVIALAAALIASYAWSTVPQPLKPAAQALNIEDYLLGLCVALTLAPLALGRRSAAAQWAMAGAFFLWLWIVDRTAATHAWPGNQLPFHVLVLAGVGLWFVDRRRELLGIKQDPAIPQFKVARETFVALGVALALQFGLVIALTNAPIPIGMRLGTLAILFLGLGLLACFGMAWVFLPKYATLPSLAVVPLLWGMFAGNTPEYALQGTQFAKDPPARPRLTDHFKEWLTTVPSHDDSPIFFVAAAGGGLRAAYWTAHMLAAADDRTCGEFGRHVYAYSGVSGGSLGIAAYLAQRQVWERMPGPERCQTSRRHEMRSMLRRDFLAPVAGSLLFAEMTQRFVPFDYLKDDRGSTLAKAWSAAWDDVFPDAKGKFDRPFLEVFAAGSNPAVFLNATAVETGRRVLATNVQRSRVPAAVDLFRPVRGLGALDTAGLTVRDAVLNSARFTYVSPAATVSACKEPAEDGTCPEYTKVWDRLVDGGYFENSGLATLSDVIRALDAEPAKRRFIVIVIDNSNEGELACPQRRADAEGNEEPPALEVTALSHFTAPIEALLRVRESRGQLELRRVRAEFDCKEGRLLDWNLFGDHAERKEARAAGQEPALGWFLSQRSAKWIFDRAEQVALHFPFRHAACFEGPLPKGQTLVGESTQPNVVCGPFAGSAEFANANSGQGRNSVITYVH